MDLVTGAMGSLLPKMAELLKEEYKLQNSVKEGINSLVMEMKSMDAALRKVADVQRDQLDEQIKLWAGEVRELSFDMEDVIDKFLVRVDDGSQPISNSNKLKHLMENMAGLFTKGKARHEIDDAIKDINKKLQQVTDRRGRYTVHDIVARPTSVTTIDPRIGALYKDVTELVGIAGKRDQELMNLLSDGDSMSKKKLKIVSVVGFGGLGKTTLVKTVYDKIKGDFDCRAFVPVGRDVGAIKVLRDILLDLGMYKNEFKILDVRQLIDKLVQGLESKRYLIVIDDIWDVGLWNIMKLAFCRNSNFSSRLLMTTRIVKVAESCRECPDDSIYKMKALSDDDSKMLLYKRIFSHEGGCPDEFEEVSIDILKKCGGVPLAIITIASLLASDQRVNSVDEWRVLLKCIGRGLTEDPSVEVMMRILSFSYYDLPSHLKTCLLYLSMFPEEYRFVKDQLISMWIAESFVQCKNAEICPFVIGETYFNDLVNRNMIMPIYDDEGTLVACSVHDMVLDLISSLSREDNFVTVLNGAGDSMSSQSNIRRLSLQNARKGELGSTPLKSVSMVQVRSIAAFRPAIGLMPSFSRFVVLRVLHLNGSNISACNHLNLRDLGSLLHLRYLGLAQTGISKLPEEVGKLQFLQVLDLSGNDVKELPPTIIKLRRLMSLLLDSDCTGLPDGLGNLTLVEVLSKIHCDSLSVLKGLGNMTRLRKLGIEFSNLSLELEEEFVVTLSKLSNIQCLEVSCAGEAMELMDILGECWVPPRSLREFTTAYSIKFSTLPAGIRSDPSRLMQLSRLEIAIEKVQQDDMDILKRLPALRILILWSEHQSGMLLIGPGWFRCLTSFMLGSSSPRQIMFQPGAMPKAEHVVLPISLQVAKEDAAGNGDDSFDLGTGNLPSLRKVDVKLDCVGVTVREAKQAKAALEAALHAHPNSPTFLIRMRPYPPQDAHDDDVCSEEPSMNIYPEGSIYPLAKHQGHRHPYSLAEYPERARCKERVNPQYADCCIM